ncbi:hypothetical protein Cgig2_032280 [Carnegiea gigantea]|uniref:Uncharacterized protein n=1 Tax=Carnegiea gigantea TaxID=171969 RepID=A0A9Q1JLP9_9CARY|nr:hypothetical protein Cgig2_032280 [Carnegiea gigantea]
MAKCCELKKAFHELAIEGQIDHFLKTGPRFLRREQEPAQPRLQDKECFTKVMATITRGYAEGMMRSAWKAQLRGTQQVLTVEQGARVTVPTTVFGGRETPRYASPHNDPLVIEMKVASAIVRRILIDKGTSVDFLVADVPKTYNIILGRPNLHKVKAIIAPYLLQLQFEADEESVGTPIGASGPKGTKKETLKKSHIGPPTIVAALIIRSLGLSVQRVGLFAFQTIPLAGRWVEHHFFGFLALDLNLDLDSLALIHIVEVGLKVVILLEVLSQCHQDLAQVHYGVLTTLLIALLLDLGHSLSPRSCLNLSFRKRLIQLALQIFFLSLPGIFLFFHLLLALRVLGH